VRADQRNNLAKHLRRHYLNLVQNEQSPVYSFNLVHVKLFVFISLSRVTNHRVSAYHYACLIWLKHLASLLRSERNNRRPVKICPSVKLCTPLRNRNVAATKHKRALLNMRSSGDPCQCLTCTAGQHDNTRPCSAVAKHLAQTLLLIVSDHRCRLKFNF
jgi:hypothetical protein